MERTNYTNFARPSFVLDWQSVDRDQGHQIDWALTGEAYRETSGGVVKVDANAIATAVALTVEPLTFALPANTILYFGGEKIAVVTVAAAIGDTALTVAALPNALAIDDVASVTGSGKKTIVEGTVMEVQASGKMIPTADPAGGGLAHGLLIGTAVEGSKVAAKSGYGLIIGGVVFENLLPEATGGPPKTLPAGLKTALATSSKGFVYRTYADTRA